MSTLPTADLMGRPVRVQCFGRVVRGTICDTVEGRQPDGSIAGTFVAILPRAAQDCEITGHWIGIENVEFEDAPTATAHLSCQAFRCSTAATLGDFCAEHYQKYASSLTTVSEIRYSRDTHDYDCYVSVDGQAQYIGSRSSHHEAERLINGFTFDLLCHQADSTHRCGECGAHMADDGRCEMCPAVSRTTGEADEFAQRYPDEARLMAQPAISAYAHTPCPTCGASGGRPDDLCFCGQAQPEMATCPVCRCRHVAAGRSIHYCYPSREYIAHFDSHQVGIGYSSYLSAEEALDDYCYWLHEQQLVEPGTAEAGAFRPPLPTPQPAPSPSTNPDDILDPRD